MVRCFASVIVVVSTAGEGPCDITGKAGNECVAAHSTTRALYSAYNGPLYKVTRNSDGQSADIGVLSPGGFANVATHDAFCEKLDCVIAIVYDQSPQGNHLGQRHKLVEASRHKITVGQDISVYGMWFDKGYGYHVDYTTGIPKDNEPESIYAVMSGTHYNGGCCFDYGNSENSVVAKNKSQGAGTMEAIYFGNAHWQGNTGDGEGPWVGADLECGMYYGGGDETKVNKRSKSLPHEFVSLYLRGGTDGMVLKGGDATSGDFVTMYEGARPNCTIAGTCHRHGEHTYQPMSKKGAIILGTGGDNSNSAQGKFYEGIMVLGETTDATDDAVQANIVGVGYRNIQVLDSYTAVGGDCSGNNMQKSSADTAEVCAEKCETTVGCTGISHNLNKKVCWTKSATCSTPTTGNGFEFYSRNAGPVSLWSV